MATLFNPTTELLRGRYDWQGYDFPPGKYVELPDDAAYHCYEYLRCRGLVVAKFGDDPAELAAKGLEALQRWEEDQIAAHEKLNLRQKENNLMPVAPTPALKAVIAKRKAVGKPVATELSTQDQTDVLNAGDRRFTLE